MTESPGPGAPEDDRQAGRGTVSETDDPSLFERDGFIAETLAAIEAEAGLGPVSEGKSPEGGIEPAATSPLVEITTGIRGLAAKQEELRELFESRLRSDEVQAKALERLHDQLRDYKANFVRQEMQPLLRDLIFCYDFAADEVERAGREGPPPTAKETARAFDHLRQMVADVLAKYDVEPYRAPGPDFDRREQQCVRTVPTAVAADEKKVAAVGAVGFRLADQIVRKEQVTVYKYAPGMAAEAGESPSVAEGS